MRTPPAVLLDTCDTLFDGDGAAQRAKEGFPGQSQTCDEPGMVNGRCGSPVTISPSKKWARLSMRIGQTRREVPVFFFLIFNFGLHDHDPTHLKKPPASGRQLVPVH